MTVLLYLLVESFLSKVQARGDQFNMALAECVVNDPFVFFHLRKQKTEELNRGYRK